MTNEGLKIMRKCFDKENISSVEDLMKQIEWCKV